MKSIHAVSNILAVWRIGSSASPMRADSSPARTGEFHAQSGHRSMGHNPSGRVDSQAPMGLSALLSVALLQGSSTDRRRN